MTKAVRWDFMAALGVAGLMAVLFAWPLLTRISATGVWDWPEATAHYEAARLTILRYEQFPFWNPYMCSGAPGLANPQTYWLSLTFLFALMFGVVAGPKLAAVAYLTLGGLGMWLLLRRLKIAPLPALLGPAVWLLNGFIAVHISGGQWLWLTLAWVPWVVYGYVRSREHWGWIVFSGAFLAMIGLEGRSYLVGYLAIGLAALGLMEDILIRQKGRGLLRAGAVLTAAFLLGAWKFIPDLHFLSIVSQSLGEGDIPAPGLTLLKALVTRPGWVNDPTTHLDFIETGTYIGVVPAALAVLGLWAARGKRLLLVLTFFGIVFLAIALSGEDSILELAPVLKELRNPQRAMSLVLLAAAALAATGLDWTGKKVFRKQLAARAVFQAAVVIFITFDLLFVAWPALREGFKKVDDAEAIGSAPAFIDYTFRQDAATNPYDTVRQNHGAAGFCPAVLQAWRDPEKAQVRVSSEERYQGFAFAAASEASVGHKFTPNRITVYPPTDAATTIVINQNFAPGWQASAGEIKETEEGLLSAVVPADAGEVVLTYRPPGFLPGLGLTLIFLAALAYRQAGVGYLAWRIHILPRRKKE